MSARLSLTRLGSCRVGRALRLPTTPVPRTQRGAKLPNAVSNSLIQVLKDELKYQKEEYRTPFDSEEGPPAPFELEEAPGKRVFSLSGKFGDELVEVELDLEDQPGSAISEDDESAYEDEVEEVESVTFTCRITKNERVLSFECESDGDSVTIHHLELLTEPEDEDSTLPPYTGPVFPDLDDTLKQAFVDYLEERGITAELGEYLMLLTADKGWNEYMSWLTKVKGFIAER